MSAPFHGPREVMRRGPLTEEQRDKILCAIGLLEDAQVSIHDALGDSVERTTVCRVLERLYPITSPHRCVTASHIKGLDDV